MRPTALTIVLYVFFVGLSLAWSTNNGGTYHNDGRIDSWVRVGPFVSVTVLEDGAARTRSVNVGWVAVGFFLLASFAAARVAASGLERVVRGTVPLARILLVGSVLTLALAFVVAVGWSRYYWGYVFSRPPIADAVSGIKSVDSVSDVACDLSSGKPRCEVRPDRPVLDEIAYCRKETYECTRGRIVVGLQEAGLLRGRPAAVTDATVRQVEAVLSGATFLVRAEDGYDGDRMLGGIVAAGRSVAGEPMLVMGLGGGQISNDHFAYYELRTMPSEGAVRVLRKRVFFYDVAGLEGFEWRAAFVVGAVLGLTAWVPIGLAAGVAIGWFRQRRRAWAIG